MDGENHCLGALIGDTILDVDMCVFLKEIFSCVDLIMSYTWLLIRVYDHVIFLASVISHINRGRRDFIHRHHSTLFLLLALRK